MSSIQELLPRRIVVNDEEKGPDDDLKTRLHAMEARLRRMRDQRASHNEDARRAANSRNSVQEQSKDIRSSIEENYPNRKKSEPGLSPIRLRGMPFSRELGKS